MRSAPACTTRSSCGMQVHGVGSGITEDVDGLRALARLLLVAKAPLFDVDIALDVLVNKGCVLIAALS